MASIPEIKAGKVTETTEAMPPLVQNEDIAAEALGKIMGLAEEDPNAGSYFPEDEEIL